MKVETWCTPDHQMAKLGRHNWSVARLFELARELPVMEIPLDHMYLYYTYEKLTLRELVMHMRAVMDADLSKPIILDEDGEIMDGRHRLMKAMMQAEPFIKAVRFEKNPSPCRVDEDR